MNILRCVAESKGGAYPVCIAFTFSMAMVSARRWIQVRLLLRRFPSPTGGRPWGEPATRAASRTLPAVSFRRTDDTLRSLRLPPSIKRDSYMATGEFGSKPGSPMDLRMVHRNEAATWK